MSPQRQAEDESSRGGCEIKKISFASSNEKPMTRSQRPAVVAFDLQLSATTNSLALVSKSFFFLSFSLQLVAASLGCCFCCELCCTGYVINEANYGRRAGGRTSELASGRLISAEFHEFHFNVLARMAVRKHPLQLAIEKLIAVFSENFDVVSSGLATLIRRSESLPPSIIHNTYTSNERRDTVTTIEPKEKPNHSADEPIEMFS